jgi:hypothetical protein
MITLNEQIIIANTQNWVVANIRQDYDKENKLWSALVVYSAYNENNEFVDSYEMRYTNEDYNKWFNEYNSGSYLLQNLIKAKELNAKIDSNIDSEFLNNT